MADNHSLNDPELLDVEQMLRGLSIAPPASRRDQLLFACGEAAGRASLHRRVRVLSTVAVLLCLSSLSLGARLWMHTPQETIGPLAASATPAPLAAPSEVEPVREFTAAQARASLWNGSGLRVGDRMSYDAVARDRFPSVASNGIEPPPSIDTSSRLRAGSHVWLLESL